jgi:5'-nucleotidase
MRVHPASPSGLTIAVDMDEVLADTLGHMLALYNRKFDADVQADAMHGTELADIVPAERRAWVLGMLHEPGFFAEIPPMPGALKAMERLCREYRVYVASAAMEFPGSFGDKMDWLKRHLPWVPVSRYIFCMEKFVLDVDYLIDDTPSHFEGMRGTGLLFDAPHNRLPAGEKDRYSRVHGWESVEEAIAKNEAAVRL